MPGYIILHISDNKINKISKSLFNNHKSVTEFANKDVLEAMLYYDTYNRKPSKLYKIEFDRIKTDANANIIYSEAKIYCNYLIDYIVFSGIGSSPERNIPLPRSPIIPNNDEKQLLYKFINNKFPLLAEDCPYYVELYISNQINNYNANKKIVKKSYSKEP